MSEFLQSAPDGLAIAAEEPSDVADAAVAKFGSFDGSIDTVISFAQGMKDLLHRAFEIERIVHEHGWGS